MSISGVGGGASMMRSFQPPTFSSLDSNSSGDITLDELKSGAPGGASDSRSAARAEKLFKSMDADGSGSVSTEEKDAFDAKLQERQQAMQFMTQMMAGGLQPPSNDEIFAATDTDASGGVSLEEFSDTDAADGLSQDALEELFSAIDADGDGAISATESSDFLDTVKSALSDQMRPPAAGPGAGGPPPGPPPGGPPPDGTETETESEDSTAADLLTAARNAYSATQKNTDLLSMLTGMLDEAA